MTLVPYPHMSAQLCEAAQPGDVAAGSLHRAAVLLTRAALYRALTPAELEIQGRAYAGARRIAQWEDVAPDGAPYDPEART